MGRELKRVPLNFDWPLNEPWKGYLNPHYDQSTDCPECAGSGYSTMYRLLKDRWYGNASFKPEDRGSVSFTPSDRAVRNFAEKNVAHAPGFYGTGEDEIVRECSRLCVHFNESWSHHLNADDVAALIQSNRLMDLTHTWSPDAGWKPKDPPYVPTPREVNEWSLYGFGHDSINCWVVVKAECERLGCESECGGCHGEGRLWPSEEVKRQYENWKKFEPPVGDGYQIWETVSEGSPVSPVFAEPERLAKWMVENDDSATRDTTKEQWLKFILGPGWAPSMASIGGKFMSGVAAVTEGK